MIWSMEWCFESWVWSRQILPRLKKPKTSGCILFRRLSIEYFGQYRRRDMIYFLLTNKSIKTSLPKYETLGRSNLFIYTLWDPHMCSTLPLFIERLHLENVWAVNQSTWRPLKTRSCNHNNKKIRITTCWIQILGLGTVFTG